MDKRQGFIEDFEEDQAVIFQADRSTIRIARSSLPSEAQRGQFVVELDDSDRFQIDYATTEKRMRVLRYMCESYFD